MERRELAQARPNVRDEATAVDIGERRRLTPWHHLARLSRRAEVMVGSGAILGVFGRYEVSSLTKHYLPAPIPVGTLLINLAGCLVIGVVQTLFLDLGAIGRPTQLFLAVGLCGGFTTFSTFSVETVQLIQAGKIGLALAYQTLSLLGGLLAVLFGIGLAHAVHRQLERLHRRAG